MNYPPPTDGVGVPTRVVVSPSSVQLSLSGTDAVPAVPTCQLEPILIDLLGAQQTSAASFSFSSLSPNVASVSDSGLVTAVATGQTTVEVSYPSGPGSKLFAEVVVVVGADPLTAVPVWATYQWKNVPYLLGKDVPLILSES